MLLNCKEVIDKDNIAFITPRTIDRAFALSVDNNISGISRSLWTYTLSALREHSTLFDGAVVTPFCKLFMFVALIIALFMPTVLQSTSRSTTAASYATNNCP